MEFKNDLEKEMYYSGELSYCYFCLKQFLKTSDTKKSPIDFLISKSIKSLDKDEFLEEIETITYLVSTIIKCKKELGYEVDDDKKFLKTVRSFKKNIKSK